MNEKSLNYLLASAIRSGDIPLDIDDAFVDHLLQQPGTELPEPFRKQVKAKLKVRIQDAAIAKARSTVLKRGPKPLGRFLEAIREKAGLDRLSVGERLRKPDEFVERLERGHINPLKLTPPELADIVEIFDLNLSILRPMLIATVNAASSKHALEAFVRTVRPETSPSSPVHISEELRSCVAKLHTELERRGRSDLLC